MRINNPLLMHEWWPVAYAVSPGGYENICVNMPPSGLPKAGSAYSVARDRHSAAARLRARSM